MAGKGSSESPRYLHISSPLTTVSHQVHMLSAGVLLRIGTHKPFTYCGSCGIFFCSFRLGKKQCLISAKSYRRELRWNFLPVGARYQMEESHTHFSL